MIIKKFIGKTELEATEAAKAELGENMVIMNVKFVKAKGAFSFFKKKQVEITAALEDDEEPIRQIRRIAQAQVAAQEKEKKGGFSVSVDDSTPLSSHSQKADAAAAAIAEAGNRTGIGPADADKKTADDNNKNSDSRNNGAVSSENGNSGNKVDASSAIERKLDNLQSLLESQLNRENEAVKAARDNAGKAESMMLDDDAEESTAKKELAEKAEEFEQQDKEISRFLRLLYNTMIDNEVDERYANEIMGDAEKNRKPGVTMDFILGTIYQKMILKFGKSEGIHAAEKGPKIVFFIGPTGVGKTTTIAKVASSFSVTDKKKIALVTTDTYRIAATDQLRTYAGILEVPFRVIYEPEELAVAVKDFSSCDYIFVDSAGHSHKNEELLQKQKEYLDVVGDNEKQIFLVLSATTKYRDLKHIADNYKEISDYQLIFTKLDETGEYGNIYNMRCETGASVAYVTYGQNVPDDIEIFNAQKTVKQLLGGRK